LVEHRAIAESGVVKQQLVAEARAIDGADQGDQENAKGK
jgi:hypothetical protein